VKASRYEPEIAHTSWLLKRAERAVGAALYDALRDLGITPSQYGVMQALVRLEKASSAELARAVFVTPQAMTGLVAGLERQGYIRRKPLKSSRVIEATLTPVGRRVFAEATARVAKIDMQLTSLLTDDDVGHLQRSLRNCVDALENTGRRPPEAPEEPF
jgi:DNA-binding MarR family transcriptional regulator